jgi:biopolymer transport protein ExbD
LAEVAASPVPPEVHFRPDPAARFDRVDQVLAIAAQSGAKTFGFTGNEQYRDSF